jgi:hypothetical protein
MSASRLQCADPVAASSEPGQDACDVDDAEAAVDAGIVEPDAVDVGRGAAVTAALRPT